MTRNFFLLLAFMLVSLGSYAQQGSMWSLERCVEHARTNNLSVQQSSIAVKQAELAHDNSRRDRLPNLNGSVNYGFNSGRSIDPTTNDFVTRAIHTNGVSLNTGMPIYSGGRINNAIAQNALGIQVAELDLAQLRNNIGLQVARAYLQVLLAQEQLDNSRVNLKQLQEQLAQTDKLINAGAIPANDRLNIEAEIATSEQTVISNENNVDIAYLSLKQLLQLPVNEPFRVIRPDISLPDGNAIEAFSLEGYFNIAKETQPIIMAGELRRQQAEKGVDIAKAALYPTISLGGGLNTNFSSIGIDQTNPQIDFNGFDTIPTTIIANGQTQVIGIVSEDVSVSFPKSGYFSQLGNNVSYFVGIQANFPIYNKGQTKIAIEQAQLGVLNQEYSNRINEQNLKTDIQRAIADAKAARKQYQAAEKRLNAQKAAFENTEQRYQAGTANSFEYNTARNNVEAAQALFISAKYDYLFKLKILDFYQGKPLSL